MLSRTASVTGGAPRKAVQLPQQSGVCGSGVTAAAAGLGIFAWVLRNRTAATILRELSRALQSVFWSEWCICSTCYKIFLQVELSCALTSFA